jgi:predicted outer membrane lipoprotein
MVIVRLVLLGLTVLGGLGAALGVNYGIGLAFGPLDGASSARWAGYVICLVLAYLVIIAGFRGVYRSRWLWRFAWILGTSVTVGVFAVVVFRVMTNYSMWHEVGLLVAGVCLLAGLPAVIAGWVHDALQRQTPPEQIA